MANTTRQIYSNKFLAIVEAKLITLGENQSATEKGGAVFFNQDWEGEVQKSGATTVNIPIEGDDPTIKDYVIATGIAPEQVDGDNLAVVVSGDHAINELLDGYEVATVPAKKVASRLNRAAKAFAKKIDTDALATLEASSNIIKLGGNITKENAYESVLSGIEKGMEDDITFSAIAVSPSTYKFLKLDPAFAKPSDMGMTLAKNGVVGGVDGIPVVVSNKLDAKTQFLLVSKDHATRIVAWKVNPKVVSLDSSANFIGASAVKGRLIFKHQITNVKGVLVATNEAA